MPHVSEGAKLHPASHKRFMGVATQIPAQIPASSVRWNARWYALYTAPRHEKILAEQISMRGIHCFLPLYRSMRRWKDRRKELALVLFPGYVFVQIELTHRLQVLQLPGAVRFVASNGQATPLPDEEIENLRTRLSGANLEPHPYLRVGRRVRVRTGPLQGLEGIIRRKKDGFRIILSIDLLMRSIAVEVGEEQLEFIA